MQSLQQGLQDWNVDLVDPWKGIKKPWFYQWKKPIKKK